MTQEKIVDNGSNENDNLDENVYQEEKPNDDKLKKILLIACILVLFSGTYYYYNNFSKNNIKNEQIVVNSIPTPKLQKSTKNNNISNKKELNLKTASNKEISKKETKKEQPIANNNSNIIKPSNKQSLLKLAMESKGKLNPFEGSSLAKNIDKTSIPIISGKIPTLGILSRPPLIKARSSGLPSLASIGNFNTFKNNDSIEVKGFIGNKVIVNINGITESLKSNQSFQNIKVISVDNKNLTAKFKKNNKIIIQNIKSLTNISNKDDVQLIKYIK